MFTGLQDTGTSGCDDRYHLEHHLIHWPIPGGNQSTYPDRLTQEHLPVNKALLLLQFFQRGNKTIEMPDRRVGLSVPRHRDRRAHLEPHRLG